MRIKVTMLETLTAAHMSGVLIGVPWSPVVHVTTLHPRAPPKGPCRYMAHTWALK